MHGTAKQGGAELGRRGGKRGGSFCVHFESGAFWARLLCALWLDRQMDQLHVKEAEAASQRVVESLVLVRIL